MANQTGELEECSKHYDNNSKNAITLFESSGKNTYHWDVLIEKVLGEKYLLLKSYFESQEEIGNALLYKMLQLIRDKDESDKLNIAKFAYLLAKLKPKNKKNIEKYQEFSTKIYDWIQNPTDRQQLITAIYIYVYATREREIMAYNNSYGNFHNNNYYNKNNHRNNSNYGNRGYNEVRVNKFEPLDKLKYVDDAEKIISKMKNDKQKIIKANQIRIILDLINEVYIPIKGSPIKELNEDTLSKLQYIKMKIAYQAGREKTVKNFVEDTNIMKHIDSVKTKDDVILLAHYMEALVAYHKYYIGLS